MQASGLALTVAGISAVFASALLLIIPDSEFWFNLNALNQTAALSTLTILPASDSVLEWLTR
ncbi:hypothetical protein A7K99_04095 [Tatumella citrea]|uniref:Uncharacterized protein n=1 Tax=Tatumella citrea TaxID=53336 RepID=A0A1Y0L4U7_TATCI|nr:hypothetical protein A7K98_04095 [Tatumella citrea]ARU97090.1 hypothetical protein A7K99_04095 [Tatumella citrea]